MKLPLRTKILLGLTVGAAGWRLWTWIITPPQPPTPPVAVALQAAPDAATRRLLILDHAAPREPADAGALTEDSRMAALREAVDARPAEALESARALERDLPEGRFADERSLLTMQALVHLNRIGEARGEAKRFYERFPKSAWTERVFRLTGYQARPKPGPSQE